MGRPLGAIESFGRDFSPEGWYSLHMKNKDTTQSFPSVQVTVDAVVLTLVDGDLSLLLVRRAQGPFKGRWGLPGGFIHADEDQSSLDAVRRVIRQKASLEVRHLEQLGTFASATRDPRGWSASIAYVAVSSPPEEGLAPGVRFVSVDSLPHLPFDHGKIVESALARVRNKASYSTLPALFLPRVFTLPELQAVYEKVFGVGLNTAAFRRKILSQDLVEPVSVPQSVKPRLGRPAQHYQLKADAMTDLGRVVMLPDARRGG